ncbi:MAG: dihydroneopterin triphosphate diphosphatase [Casimicrobiaceae bacterium]
MKRLKRPFSVLVVIRARADGRTLLIERADAPGFWQSVTGSCEAGESVRQTALREVAEETGFQIDPDSPDLRPIGLVNVFAIYPMFRHRYPAGTTHNTETCFLLDLPDTLPPRLAPSEHHAWAWCTMPEAIAKVRSWSNQAALRRVAQLK